MGFPEIGKYAVKNTIKATANAHSQGILKVSALLAIVAEGGDRMPSMPELPPGGGGHAIVARRRQGMPRLGPVGCWTQTGGMP